MYSHVSTEEGPNKGLFVQYNRGCANSENYLIKIIMLDPKVTQIKTKGTKK